MSDEKIVERLIHFVENVEKEANTNKLVKNRRAKNDVVKSILDELEREMNHENK